MTAEELFLLLHPLKKVFLVIAAELQVEDNKNNSLGSFCSFGGKKGRRSREKDPLKKKLFSLPKKEEEEGKKAI